MVHKTSGIAPSVWNRAIPDWMTKRPSRGNNKWLNSPKDGCGIQVLQVVCSPKLYFTADILRYGVSLF